MNEIEWRPEKMLEIKLKEPDDFLKVTSTILSGDQRTSGSAILIVFLQYQV